MAEIETVVAISTPLGEGGIGIVRLSGPMAIAIGQRVFIANPPLGERFRQVEFGTILDQNQQALDQGLAWAFRAPSSYTGEDTVEISCHGSLLVLESLVHAAIAHGARLAEPGEFTRRAYLNGRLDLLQAEGVIDLIQAGSRAGMHNAYGHTAGGLSKLVDQLKGYIISALSLIEVGLDFTEEDIRTIGHSEVRAQLADSLQLTQRLLDTFEGARRRQSGMLIALVGSPNAGKSTLLNSLLGEDRAIVTPTPGTTRDTVEGQTIWAGESIRLVDTAGIRQGADPIEEKGIERSYQVVEAADLVLYVLDGSKRWGAEEEFLFRIIPKQPGILLLNKADLPLHLELPEHLSSAFPSLKVSGLTGSGIAELAPLALSLVRRPTLVDGIGLTRSRHQEGLQLIFERLEASLALLDEHEQEECIAAELQEALSQIGELLGEEVSEAVLDRIFSQFCIGK